MDWRLVPLEHVCSINPKDRDSHELPDDTLVSFVPMRAVSETSVFPGEQYRPAICTKNVYRIQVDRSIDPEYLSAAVRFSERVRAQLGASVTGQIVSGLTSEVLKRLLFVIPPISLQRAFAIRKGAIDAIRQRARRAQKRSEALSSALLQRAFSEQLTASWREANMKESVREMELRARAIT